MQNKFSDLETDRIIEMAWEDRTPFEAIELQFGINNAQVIVLMRQHMLPSSFRRWRKRTTGRATKHGIFRNKDVTRFKCSMQKTITGNKITKR